METAIPTLDPGQALAIYHDRFATQLPDIPFEQEHTPMIHAPINVVSALFINTISIFFLETLSTLKKVFIQHEDVKLFRATY